MLSLKIYVVVDINEEIIESLEVNFSYLLVLKMLEGFFFKGVFKVVNCDELVVKLIELFEFSVFVLV